MMITHTYQNLCLFLLLVAVAVSTVNGLPTSTSGKNIQPVTNATKQSSTDLPTLEGVHANLCAFRPYDNSKVSIHSVTFGEVVISSGEQFIQPEFSPPETVAIIAGRHESAQALNDAIGRLKADKDYGLITGIQQHFSYMTELNFAFTVNLAVYLPKQPICNATVVLAQASSSFSNLWIVYPLRKDPNFYQMREGSLRFRCKGSESSDPMLMDIIAQADITNLFFFELNTNTEQLRSV